MQLGTTPGLSGSVWLTPTNLLCHNNGNAVALFFCFRSIICSLWYLLLAWKISVTRKLHFRVGLVNLLESQIVMVVMISDLPCVRELEMAHHSDVCVLLRWVAPLTIPHGSSTKRLGYRVYVNGVAEGMVRPHAWYMHATCMLHVIWYMLCYMHAQKACRDHACTAGM